MPGLVRKVLSSFTLQNFRKLIRFLFSDYPRPRFKDIAIFLRLLSVDTSELRDDELHRVAAIREKIHKAIHRILGFLSDIDKELIFRKRRLEFKSLTDKEIEFKLMEISMRQVEETLREPIRDEVDKALLIEANFINGKHVSMEEYVLKRILHERLKNKVKS